MSSSGPKIELTTAALNHIILTSYPSIIGHGLILLEALRTLPAELRMWCRIYKRKRANAAECMFLAIKYFAILGYVCDAVVRASTLIKTDQGCYNVHYTSLFCIFLATSLVASAIAWRTYIIFQCRRIVYWILAIALLAQFVLCMVTMSMQYKYSVLQDGYCVSKHSIAYFHKVPPHKLLLPWYLFYNGLYDLIITAAATRHLIKTMGAPHGFSEVGRVLFQNNVHYVLVVCSCNLVLSVIFWTVPYKLPSLMPVSSALQIIAGLNLLASEQDLVHRPTGTRVSHAPSHEKGGPASSPSSGGGSWHSSSKQEISTFQSDTTSGGSPILQSIWSRKANNNNGSEDTKKTPTVITFEQDKVRFYDDPATPTGKRLQRPSWKSRITSPLKKEEDDVFFTMQGNNGMDLTTPSPSTVKSNFSDLTLPLHVQKKEESSYHQDTKAYSPTKNSSTSPILRKVELPGSIMDMDMKKEHSNVTSTPSGGVSIRSIRANIDSPPRFNGTLNYNSKGSKPIQMMHRPSTSPTMPSHPRELGSSPTLSNKKYYFDNTLDYIIPSRCQTSSGHSLDQQDTQFGASLGNQPYPSMRPSLRKSASASLRCNTSHPPHDLELGVPHSGTFGNLNPSANATHSSSGGSPGGGLRRPINAPPVSFTHHHNRGQSQSSFGSMHQINPLQFNRSPSFEDALQDSSEIDHGSSSHSEELCTISFARRTLIETTAMPPMRPSHSPPHF